MEDLFGPVLTSKNGNVATSEALNGKIVLVYFSAHWCPPCRGFTPVLAKFYTDLKGKRQDFEFVFASSDQDEGQFSGYFKEMPWLAIPFENRQVKDALSKKFGIRGIPTLVVLNASGELISLDGRALVSGDLSGAKFPWA